MPQVLLVDDNVRALDGLRRHIPWQETGCVCVGTAQNGVEALALCHTLQPDVVITDVKMPQMDGIELCQQLRNTYPDMHLIVISAYDDFGYAQRAMTFGVTNYLLKPIDNQKISEITQLLIAFSQRSHQHTVRLATFFASSVIADLRQALIHANDAQVHLLLNQCLHDDGVNLRDAKEMATNLVAALYHHVSHIGLPPNIIGKNLSESLAALQTFHTLRSVNNYVSSQYQWVCQHVALHRNPSTEQIVTRIQTYICQNFTDAAISTYALAQKFHLSQSYLCQIYRTYAQTNINTTITQLRIDYACQLLTNDSTIAIAEVSKLVGYLDAQYFAKVFRRIKGLTPSEYRELVQRT